MASKTSYVRIAAFAAATVAVLFVMHARRAPRRQPAAAQQDGVASDQPLSANWPLGVYSDNKEWLTFHELMVKELRDSEKEQGFQLIFYGDSITEQWRGTIYGNPCDRPGCPEGPDIFRRYFGQWRSAAFAISGDTPDNLLWRLRNGELPSPDKAPVAVFVMIGTNEMDGGRFDEGPEEESRNHAEFIVSRIWNVLDLLRKSLPRTKVVAIGLLPRGEEVGETSFNRVVLRNVNAGLAKFGELYAEIEYADCSQGWMKGGKVIADLMPDYLHPSGPGMELWARCLQRVAQRFIGTAQS